MKKEEEGFISFFGLIAKIFNIDLVVSSKDRFDTYIWIIYRTKVSVISALYTGIIEQKTGFILQTVMKCRTNIALISILR